MTQRAVGAPTAAAARKTCPYTPKAGFKELPEPADQVQAEEAAFTGAYYLISGEQPTQLHNDMHCV